MGIYNLLWQEILKKAESEEVFSIDARTHIDNKAMRAVAKAQGRTEYAILTRYVNVMVNVMPKKR